ncbi:MAG: 4Fe-4S dicluster domain-containing protein [Bacteroidota bacterium]|nr:4Fe-4S dicluster domain-containing protein [Bacteroidota bacterium]
MSKINNEFSTEIEKFGSENINACYNCGNCTAVCSLSTEENSFPREMIRLSILGLEDDIQGSLKPWLCYYCGECSETCPRLANPGELMMALRRWLTAKYDWTGLSGLLYKSFIASLLGFILTAAAVIFFVFYKEFDTEAIMHVGHLFEMIAIATVATVILLPNIVRMHYFTITKKKIKPSLKQYFKSFKELLVHMFVQKEALGCEDNKFRWFEHFILVIGYLMLLFTTVVLDWFNTEFLAVHIFGYIMSAIVFIVTFDFVLSRMKKKTELSKHSRPSDWLFVIWLFLLGFTSFLVRLFIDIDLLENNFWMYIVHMIVLVQWALLIVPFGKWTHFLYRSFAMYFQHIIDETEK